MLWIPIPLSKNFVGIFYQDELLNTTVFPLLGQGRGQLKAGLHKVSQGGWAVLCGAFCGCQLERLSSLQAVHEEPKHPPEPEKFDSSRLNYGYFQIWPWPTCSSTRRTDKDGSRSPFCHGRWNTNQHVPAWLPGKWASLDWECNYHKMQL